MPSQRPNPITPGLSIRLFGPYQVELDGQLLSLRHSRKEQWLLALLTLRQGRVVERDWLADILWPESPRSRVLLRDTLYDLRQTLGSQAARLISPTKQTLQLKLEGVEVDVLAYDEALIQGDSLALEKAVGLYRGALLEGCTEEWVYPERQAREQSYLSALETLAEQKRTAGDSAAAVRYLQRVIGVDGLREHAHGQLMQALADQGDYAALVQAYRDLRLLLYRELNADPSAEITALFHRLRDEGRRAAPVRSTPSIPLLVASNRTLHNLPPFLTSFIGREQEREEIKFLHYASRLLTLTGSGGCGKTRLSLQVAAEMIEDYPDGVWFVELAALSDPALVTRTVAGALGLTDSAGRPVDQMLLEFLKERRTLLILDNCEHLLDACAALADTLLKQCPQVRLLASSRASLGIRGEQIYRVPSLSLPMLPSPSSASDKGRSRGGALQSLMESEAVRLFLDRARAVQPAFALTPANAYPLAQACIRLDGIPLAIELAAPWVRSLSVEEINLRLDNRFRLLAGGSRTALPRQQTLRALIDWSYDLLTEAEKRLFARLPVFAGGWTLEAAEAVCLESWEVLILLSSLVDKSLVTYVPSEAGVGRYRLLETVRQYAGERLAESGEETAVRGRHRDFFLTLAKAAEPRLAGSEQPLWLERLEEEHENLRASLEWSLAEADTEDGLQFCGALSRYWMIRGHFWEGREWCARFLARVDARTQTAEISKTFNCAGGLAYMQADYASAHAHYEATLGIYRQIQDPKGVASALVNLGMVANAQGDLTSAKAYFGESVVIWQELGERRGMANALSNLGLVASTLGEIGSARSYHEESLAIRKEFGDRHGIATSLNNLGMVAIAQGDPAASHAYLVESLTLYQEIGDRRGIAMSLNNLGAAACSRHDYASARSYLVESLTIWNEIGERRGMAYTLEAFADLAFKESSLEVAATLWGIAETLRIEIGSPLKLNEREQHVHTMAAARQELGEERFEPAWARGRAMSLQQGVDYAMEASA